MKNTECLLSVQNLSVSFKSNDGWKQVVHSISYDVYRGMTLGLVGESGSGKTVSSLACMGLLPEKTARVDGGTIVFKGKSLLGNNFEGARQQRGCSIAMIFQEPMTSLNPSMRCGEQVEEVIAAHLKLSKAEGEKRVVDLFKEVELPEPESIGKRYPHELSGGQKQRVMIAIALAADPDLIIADEPTTALDVTVQRAVIDLLHRLKESRGLGLIFISHDLDVVGAVADDIVVLQHGNIRETGRTIDILTNPQDPYTIKLLSCKPPTSGERLPLADPENTKPYQFSIGTSPILAVRKLKKTFVTKKSLFGKPTATYEALKEISFDLFEGESLGIVGESGCGKTTVSRIVMGLEKADGGEIAWSHGRPAIQLVFQDPYASLNPRKTVAQMLTEALEFAGNVMSEETPEHIARLLKEVDLPLECQSRYPHSFSGGQRQRLVIARALAANPSVLILDESVAALDVSVQAQVLNLLNEIRSQRKLSYIFISHDLHVVRYMCERMIVMHKGQIVEQGNSDQIMQSPTNGYTRKLIDSIYKSIT